MRKKFGDKTGSLVIRGQRVSVFHFAARILRTWRNFKRPLEGEGRGGNNRGGKKWKREVKAEFKVTRDIVTWILHRSLPSFHLIPPFFLSSFVIFNRSEIFLRVRLSLYKYSRNEEIKFSPFRRENLAEKLKNINFSEFIWDKFSNKAIFRRKFEKLFMKGRREFYFV